MTDGEKPFVMEALQSVLEQTVNTDIIICVRDGNDWINNLLQDLAVTPKVLRLPLSPPGITRNYAIDEVQTKYLAFLDADDIWLPEKLEMQLESLNKNNWRISGCKHVLVSEEGRPYFYGFAKDIPMTSSWMGETDIFKKYKFGNEPTGAEVVLWKAVRTKIPIGILSKYLIKYRVRYVSVSTSRFSKKRKLMFARLSRFWIMRYMLLSSSYLVNYFK
jgi:glycosyltransferase involved in cell wall biosynthesis